MQELGFLIGVGANVCQLAGIALVFGETKPGMPVFTPNRTWKMLGGSVLIVAPMALALLPLKLDFYVGCLTIPGLIGNIMFLFGVGMAGPKAPLGGALFEAMGTFLIAAAPTVLIGLASLLK